MSIKTDVTTLKQIITPGLAIRADGECCVEVTDKTVRLRAISVDKIASLDYSLPTDTPKLCADVDQERFWISVERVRQFLQVASDGPVKLLTSSEGNTSALLLRSGRYTYRFPPVNSRIAHRLTTISSDEPTATCSISHGHFARAVSASNLVGDCLEITLNPATETVKFSAGNDDAALTFSYSLPPTDINCLSGSPASLRISNSRLKGVTPHVPPDTIVSLQLTENVLSYHVEYPVTGANLVIECAKRLTTIQN